MENSEKELLQKIADLESALAAEKWRSGSILETIKDCFRDAKSIYRDKGAPDAKA